MAFILYKGRCPCPNRLEYGDFPLKQHCSKAGGVLCKDWDRDIVVDAVINHLVQSPYHKFEREEAIEVAEHTLIEEEAWTQEEYDLHMAPPPEPPRDDDRKRARPISPRRAVPPPPVPTSTIARRHGSGSGSSGSNDTVQIRASELQIVLDSMKRAMNSARSAEKLCDSAASSFRMEANAIEAAHAHFSQLAMFR